MCFAQSQYKGGGLRPPSHKGGGLRPPPQRGGGGLRPPLPFVVSFVLAVSTGHILVSRCKTCALLRAKTSALLRRKTCAVLRARSRKRSRGRCQSRLRGSQMVPRGLPEETWTHLRRYPALSQGTWGGFGTGGGALEQSLAGC